VVAGGDEDVFNGPPQLANQLGVGQGVRSRHSRHSRHSRRSGQSIIGTATLRSASTAAARSIFIALPAPPPGRPGWRCGGPGTSGAGRTVPAAGRQTSQTAQRQGLEGHGRARGVKGLLAELDGRRRAEAGQPSASSDLHCAAAVR
jgi:hypothetical protein